MTFPRRGEAPLLPNGVPEKAARPERPRARDRPKPRRRPRPKEPSGGEPRRSRSAPAQSSPPVPQTPSHTAQYEGFLFRKLDIESQKKAANRWGPSAKSLSLSVEQGTLLSLTDWSPLKGNSTLKHVKMAALQYTLCFRSSLLIV